MLSILMIHRNMFYILVEIMKKHEKYFILKQIRDVSSDLKV